MMRLFDVRDHRLYEGASPVAYSGTPNRGSRITPTVIVLHDTAGRLDYRSSVEWLCNKDAKASAHFVIGRDGEIVQLAELNIATWHAGRSLYGGRPNVNAFSLGIEIANPGRLSAHRPGTVKAWFGEVYGIEEYGIVKAGTPHHGDGYWMPYTEKQIEAVLSVCSVLQKEYRIKSITTHWDISPGRKVDTNPLFPLEELRGLIFGYSDDEAPSFQTLVEANQRRWPSYADNVIQIIPREASVVWVRSGIFEANGSPEEWHLVQYNGSEGWVNAEYLLTRVD